MSIVKSPLAAGFVLLAGLFVVSPVLAQEKPAEPKAAKEAPKPAPSETKSTPSPADAKSKDEAPAIGGYCPVSYFTDSKAVKGDAKFRSEYQGFVYHFADAAKKETFDKNPSKYAPRIGGFCAVALGGPYGNRFMGDPRVFAVVNDKLYLLSSARAKASFDLRPEHYTDRAEALYSAASIGGYCPVKYQTDKAAVQGEPQYVQYYRGQAFMLSSAEASEKFEKDPQRYAPAFNGFCALSISREEHHPGDPKVFAVVDGRTYLFFDEAAKEQCLNRSPSCIEEAQQTWPAVEKKLYRYINP
jgi:YHS domain-containing protein